jgi:hypothetical protein
MDFQVKYDVAVVGGGIAGIAAGLQAARSGKKTVLIEKTVLLGGLATTGLVYIYLPLCDGNGRQVTFGICEELIQTSLKYGPGHIPERWREQKDGAEINRYRCAFSPAAFILALDELLEEAGVDIWLDTLVCGVELDANKRLTSVTVENKSGRGRIDAGCFIDASGDCEVARRAGCECLEEDNYLSMWAMEYDTMSPYNKDYDLADKVKVHMGGVPWGPQCPPEKVFRGISGKKVSKFVLDGRRMLRERYQKRHAQGVSDRSSFFPLSLPAMPQFRKVYCVKGRTVLKGNQHATRFEDSIGLVADWRKPGFVWEIPYGTLIPENVEGLLAAGRCVAAEGDAWEITRVIPTAALTGQVAGLAAALSLDEGATPSRLDVNLLQEKLRRLDFPLRMEDFTMNGNSKTSRKVWRK